MKTHQPAHLPRQIDRLAYIMTSTSEPHGGDTRRLFRYAGVAAAVQAGYAGGGVRPETKTFAGVVFMRRTNASARRGPRLGYPPAMPGDRFNSPRGSLGLRDDCNAMRPKERCAGLPIWLVAVQLILFGLLVCVRMPMILSSGRFWAEEGRHFFEIAWIMKPLPALFRPFAGYLNLVANAAALAARWLVPLQFAPFLTIGTGLAFQLFPPLLVLAARDPWLQPHHVRLAALTLLLLVPASEEIWLQTLTSQFELLLCCAIILALNVETGWRAWLQHGLLALAPLCGPVVIVLIPLFLLRSALDRSPQRLIQAATLTATALLQMLIFLHGDPNRQYVLHPALLLCVFTVRHMALPFLGIDIANRVAASIRASLQARQVPLLAVSSALITSTLLFAAVFRRRAVNPAMWFATAGATIAVASYVGSLGGVASMLDDVRGQERYVVVPQTLFYLGVLAFTVAEGGWATRIGWIVVLWLAGVGAYSYCNPFMARGPSWRREIALWQADPSHAIQLWPAGWAMTLDRLHRAPGSYSSKMSQP